MLPSSVKQYAEREPLTHYVIVRSDLPFGVAVAQTIHAAGESFGQVPEGTYAVALAARNEGHLALIEQKLNDAGIPHHAVREPDRNNELMAIGLQPVADRTVVRCVVGRLRLLGDE